MISLFRYEYFIVLCAKNLNKAQSIYQETQDFINDIGDIRYIHAFFKANYFKRQLLMSLDNYIF